MTAKFFTDSAMDASVSSFVMHSGFASDPNRITTTRSSSFTTAWSTAHPESRWGRRYDMVGACFDVEQHR